MRKSPSRTRPIDATGAVLQNPTAHAMKTAPEITRATGPGLLVSRDFPGVSDTQFMLVLPEGGMPD